MPVWSVVEPKRYLFRPPFPPALCTEKALSISRAARPESLSLFASSQSLPDIKRMQDGQLIETYHVALVSGLNICPPANGQ